MRAGKQKKQQGFIILMGMLALVLGAAVWFGTAGTIRSESMSIVMQNKHVDDLMHIKQKMLQYAVLNPELFANSASVPGPGYFPCPDTNANGDSDTGLNCIPNGGLYSIGMVPNRINSRFFNILNNKDDHSKYWFAVDSRFLVSNPDYTSATQRFGPLNIDLPQLINTADNKSLCDETPLPATCLPALTVDGRDEIVMVLFYTGEALAGQDRGAFTGGDTTFTRAVDYIESPALVVGATGVFNSVGASPTVFNDYVLTITLREWRAAVLSRVAQDRFPEDNVPDLCVDVDSNNSVALDRAWFNDCEFNSNIPPYYSCVYNAAAVDNYQGQNWRTVLGCPP